jgi:hypothetical protein
MKVFLLILLLCTHPALYFQPEPGIIWQDGFELYEWKKNWKIREEGSWGMENIDILKGHSTSQFLRINLPEGSLNKGRKFHSGGIHFTSDLPEADSLHLRYYIRLGQHFPIRNTIILPGLSFQDKNHKTSTDFNVVITSEGKPGISLQGNKITNLASTKVFLLEKNKWYCIEQRIKLNEIGSSNAEVKLWIDGILVMERSNLNLKTSSYQKLNAINFSAFIKNNNNSSVFERETNIDFDSFVASSVYVGIPHSKQ